MLNRPYRKPSLARKTSKLIAICLTEIHSIAHLILAGKHIHGAAPIVSLFIRANMFTTIVVTCSGKENRLPVRASHLVTKYSTTSFGRPGTIVAKLFKISIGRHLPITLPAHVGYIIVGTCYIQT